MIVHSNLDDGWGSLFEDLACTLGAVLIERYIVEDLLGATLGHCYGHTFSAPLTRLAFQRAIVDQGLAAIAPGGTMLQYSYSPISPIPAKKLDVEAKLVKFVLRNFPPATVWRYRRRGTNGAAD